MSGAMVPGARAGLQESGRALAGAGFRDATALRRGMPPGDWLTAARLGIELAMRVADGVAVLTDAALEIRGGVPDEATLAAVAGALQARLPAGYTGRAALELPEAKPFVWRLTKTQGGGAMSGAVPDAAARAELRRVAAPATGGTLSDETAVRRGAPAGDWLVAARVAVDLLARLEDGSATLTDGVLDIRGRALTDRIADSIAADLARLPAGFTGRAALRLVVEEKLDGPPIEAAEACQALIDEVMSQTTIEFDTGSAAIRQTSRRVLDRLVKAAARCPAFRIAIEGHTDNVGDEAANLALSERRAAAVAEYLVAAGVARERLATQGLGAAKPVADNATEDGRARNRRIVFAVRKAE
jgi:OOP family OmpA-OmpF porin